MTIELVAAISSPDGACSSTLPSRTSLLYGEGNASGRKPAPWSVSTASSSLVGFRRYQLPSSSTSLVWQKLQYAREWHSSQ